MIAMKLGWAVLEGICVWLTLYYGSSGALAVCRMAKAYAYLNGRDFVIPEDVAAVFPDVCCHRLVLTTKARMMEERPETVIAAILDSVKMPVVKQ